MSRLLLVSNRLPVTVKVDRDGLAVTPSAGGLATGLKGPHEKSGGIWVGWPGDVSRFTEAQRAEVDARLAALRLAPLHLSPAEVSRYYEGYSNRVLWPLCHYLLDRVPRQDRDFEVYRRVNQRFADAVVRVYQPGDTIWVHDYQLMLVPGMLRERLPGARIGYFHHIPFPASEIWRTLPSREELLRGLMGADLVGFHTLAYVRHFSSALLRLLGADTDVDRVPWGGREVRLGAFPMGIDAKTFDGLAREEDVLQEVAEHRASAGEQKLVLGIDRLDYTKGIPRRLLAVQRLLEVAPEWRGRLRFIQVAVPSRTQVDAYKEYRDRVNELVGRINGLYGTPHAVPVHYLYRGFSPRQLAALYRAADVMLVTPIRDGMNLVAKEFCAARPDEDGVLVLSELAGASAEMGEALQVNPYDVEGMSRALLQALQMPQEERRRRMQGLRARVMRDDVHRWAESFLAALARTGPKVLGDGEAALARLRAAGELVLMLDYDGTLVGFQPRPEQAAPDAELMDLVARLSRRPHTRVHVVSGRPREALEGWFGELPVGLHAEHGLWSRSGPGQGWTSLGAVDTTWKARVRPLLEDFAARVPGAHVEEKTASLAWHYRQVDSEFGAYQARELRLHLAEVFGHGPLEILPGDKVVEVRQRGVHKGRVVEAVLAEAPKGALPVVVGDDRTDEDLFGAVPEGGVTIHVGSRVTRAGYRLPDVRAVRTLLRSLL